MVRKQSIYRLVYRNLSLDGTNNQFSYFNKKNHKTPLSPFSKHISLIGKRSTYVFYATNSKQLFY